MPRSVRVVFAPGKPSRGRSCRSPACPPPARGRQLAEHRADPVVERRALAMNAAMSARVSGVSGRLGEAARSGPRPASGRKNSRWVSKNPTERKTAARRVAQHVDRDRRDLAGARRRDLDDLVVADHVRAASRCAARRSAPSGSRHRAACARCGGCSRSATSRGARAPASRSYGRTARSAGMRGWPSTWRRRRTPAGTSRPAPRAAGCWESAPRIHTAARTGRCRGSAGRGCWGGRPPPCSTDGGDARVEVGSEPGDPLLRDLVSLLRGARGVEVAPGGYATPTCRSKPVTVSCFSFTKSS